MKRRYRVVLLVLALAVLLVSTSAASLAQPVERAAAVTVLGAVSCPTSNECIAVGYFEQTADSTNFPLAEYWDGSRWSLMPTPPIRKDILLSGVSCPRRNFCIAVGNDGNADGGYPNNTDIYSVAESWNGVAWRVLPLAHRPSNVLLEGVSCASASDCVAVGNESNFNGQVPVPSPALAEYWNGAAWRVTPIPKGQWSTLTAVSCARDGTCFAVGARDVRPLAVRWQQGRWHPVSLPILTYRLDSMFGYSLDAASCLTDHFCRLVGLWADKMARLSLAEALSGKKWSVLDIPGGSVVPDQNPFYGLSDALWSGSPFLTGISCVSPTSCLAVGDVFVFQRNERACGGEQGLPCPFGVSWNGKTWTMTPVRARGPEALAAVSCASASKCMSVGYTESVNLNSDAVADQWNGARWSVTIVPTP